MRRPKRQVSPKQLVKDGFDEPRKPAYIALQDTVAKLLSATSDGFTFKQLYSMMPSMDPRRIREAVQGLEAKKICHHSMCRCGSARVYYKS